MARPPPAFFLLGIVPVVAWAVSGPVFGYSDTWQLVINTGTTVLTYLFIFLLQRAQNHGTAAIQVKLDELIRAVRDAQNEVIDIENKTEDEINGLKERLKSPNP